MTTTSKTVILLLVFAIAASSAYKVISSLEVDELNGQIYVGENGPSNPSILYELDDVSVAQNNVHHLPTSSLAHGSLAVLRRGSRRVLYAVLEGDQTDLVYFHLPLSNQQTLSPQVASTISTGGLTLEPVYDIEDNLAFLAVGRNLTLVDLNTLTVLDTFKYYIGSRIFGKNLVYNHQNNHLISFRTHATVGANAKYGLAVDEYDVSTGKLVQVDSTYDCLCHGPTNPDDSPFFRVVLNSCEIDYSVHPAEIWCADPDHSQFFRFQANNLSIFEVVPISATFATAVWDFDNSRAYAIYSELDTPGFAVHKINLHNGNVIGSVSDATISIIPQTSKLDPEEPHLYIPVDDYASDALPTQIVYVNTASLTIRVVTLNTEDLN